MPKKITVKKLTLKDFAPYGTFAPLNPPTAPALVAGDIISFWPDCGGVLSLGPHASDELAIGICQVNWRELLIDVTEYHSYASEGILPLDGDIYCHVGLPTANGLPPVDALEVFYIPKGTIVMLKPGVWHHAPHAVKQGKTVNTAILLPPRTYANDCIVKPVDPPVAFG